MAEMWYYTNEGKQMDPVSIRELKRMVTDGVLKPTDMVWKEGLPRWIRASSVKELFPDPASVLDQYFSNKDDPRPAPALPSVDPVGGPAKAAPQPVAASVDDDEARPRVKKRRDPRDEEDDRDAPRNPKNAGSSVGIIVALLLGGGLVVCAVVVGIIILVVATNRGPNANARNNARHLEAPQPAPQPRANPNDFTKVAQEFKLNVPPRNGISSREVTLRKGIEHQVSVKSEPRGPDVDLFIFNKRTGQQISFDITEGPDSLAYIPADNEGEYRIELHNLDMRQAVQSTVTIREPDPKKLDPKETLPPDVKTKSDILQNFSLPPGQDRIIKVRLHAKKEATFVVTTHFPKGRTETNHLFILKENDDTVLASDVKPAGVARIQYTSPTTETVRVRVVNTGKMMSRMSLAYTLGP